MNISISSNTVKASLGGDEREIDIGERKSTYPGPYEVTPTSKTQTLDTADTALKFNVTCHPIPFSDTANDYGGKTITIG